MVSKDGTSIWERWDRDTRDPGMNGQSQTILAGYLGAWMYQTLAGIHYDPERPGFKRMILRPQPVGDLTCVNGSYKSVYGTIVSHWKIAGGKFHWHVVIPANTTATITIPAADAATVTEGDKPANEAEGVRFLRTESQAAVYEVLSGTYDFTAPTGVADKDRPNNNCRMATSSAQ
ncbi:MAG: alpha-L-rhamnosidase C-terminal domain-containing protein [Pirellulaceae bacterium]